MADASQGGPTVVGRYVLEGEVASGGMATVYYGRRTDEEPPGTIFAIKRVHPHLAKDKRFASMFIDEARLVSRINHPNVIHTVDIIASENECLLVMEYVHGESLGRLLRLSDEQRATPRLDVVSAVVVGALLGLDSSHDATNAAGVPLNIVHRDISPQNIMVGADGVARVLDFGVAKAAGSLHVTRDGEIKGKLAYMSPEQVSAKTLDRRTDVYAAGVVLWESITMQPLFDGDSEAAIIAAVMRQAIAAPSTVVPTLPKALDALVMRALSPKADDRFVTAGDMARALAAVVPPASPAEVAAWVESLAGPALRERWTMVQTRGVVPAPQAKSGAPAAPAAPATEVFFTNSGRSGVVEAPAADPIVKATAAIERGVTTVDARMRDVTRYLPLQLQKPALTYRWWIAGAAAVLLVGLLAWVFKPTRPPAAGIVVAPDGFGPATH